MNISQTKINTARNIVGWYTLAASAKGAVPVPAASVVIVGNNTYMITHIGAVMGKTVHWQDVAASLGAMAVVNMFGKTVFIEGAKFLSWGTGSFWALAGVSALGASTAALQTYLVGTITIEMCINGGVALKRTQAKKVISNATSNYKAFVTEMKSKNLSAP